MNQTRPLRPAFDAMALVLAAALCSAQAQAQAGPPVAQPSAYTSIAIVQPANEATVFDNAGNVDVKVALSPAPDLDAGDRIALLLDGQQAALQSTTQFSLGSVVRGEHRLEARIVDRNGSTVIASAPVKFHLWQASRLFSNRRGK
jgi:hypothetical protein